MEPIGLSRVRANEAGRGVHLESRDEHGDERIVGPRSGLSGRSSYRIRSSLEKEDASVQQLRSTLSNSLVNTGIFSVFLCALANAVYVSPALDPKCAGVKGVQRVLIIEWCSMSMACFLLVIVVTVILATDMEGVPDDFLVSHLKNNHALQLPLPTRARGYRASGGWVRDGFGRARGMSVGAVWHHGRTVFPAPHVRNHVVSAATTTGKR